MAALYMVETRGSDRGSIITHNQRIIERFWFDCRNKEVIDYYRSLLFQYFVDVKFDDERNVFCLHFLFVARINQDLANFGINQDLANFGVEWSQSTEHYHTTNQLLVRNSLIIHRILYKRIYTVYKYKRFSRKRKQSSIIVEM